MEGFSFVDIYATKGIEYLLTIAFLSGFLFFAVRFLFRSVAVQDHAEPAVESGVEWFSVPKGLFFHRGHGWLSREGDDSVKVGMDDYARRLIGSLSSVDLPEVGTSLRQGEPGWGVKADGKTIPMLSPVGGRVVEVNRAALSNPALVSADPFGAGWLMKVKAPRLSTELKNLLSGDLAKRWIEDAVDSIRLRSGAAVGATIQDGGMPVDGLARALYGEEWAEKAKEELLTSDVG
jgi:glycine cleavage system H lipoate-binding protein